MKRSSVDSYPPLTSLRWWTCTVRYNLICTAYNFFHVVNDGERVEKYSNIPSGNQNTNLTLWQMVPYIESTQHIRVTITYKLAPKTKVEA